MNEINPNESRDTQSESMAIFSKELSVAMTTAGFTSMNARIQSGQALALEDMVRSATQSLQFYVFGSFCDGWGSCLSRLDGRIDNDSDIDVSFFLPLDLLHLSTESCESCTAGHQTPVYNDGHVEVNHNVNQPNMDIPKSGAVVAFDLIFVVKCCGYPRIELLQPDYKNRRDQPSQMPSSIVKLVRDEVLGGSPRCHAVTASPPGQKVGRMRVSTTLLERAVMHNLTTVQGQFFILIKFLIKKVISSRVSGLKTYMAKNLLFYMLDETPPTDWKPENLVELVRQSLQMLVEMMESSDSDDVCMRHFFLRDANIYFKTGHNRKSMLKNSVREISINLPKSVRDFLHTVSRKATQTVEFYVFFPLFALLEILSSDAMDQYDDAYKHSTEIHDKLLDDKVTDASNATDQQQLLEDIERIPGCARMVKRLLKAMAHEKFGIPLEECDAFITGVPCPSSETDLSVDEAKAMSLDCLKRSGMVDFDLTPDGAGVARFPLLQDLLSGIPNVLLLCYAGTTGESLRCASRLQDVAGAVTFVSRSRLLQRLLLGRPQLLERLMYRFGELKEYFWKLLISSNLLSSANRHQSTPEELNVSQLICFPALVVLVSFIKETRALQWVCLQLSIYQLIEAAMAPWNA